MRLVLAILLLAVVVGWATGGRIGRLSALRIRWAPLAIVGLALQFFFPSRGDGPYLFLMGSFLILTVFAAANLRTPGFALVLAGMLMNFLVIGINHGMPVTTHALVTSSQQATLTELVEAGGAKHHLAGPNDRLLFLGDVIGLPTPVGQAVSAGDVVAYLGVGYVVIAAMRRREDEVPAASSGAEAQPEGAARG